jgi:acyl-CoA dehydrogenase
VAISTVSHEAVLRATHLHWGIGLSHEMSLLRVLLRSAALGVADGPTEVHKSTFAREALRKHNPAIGPWPSERVPQSWVDAVRHASLLEL